MPRAVEFEHKIMEYFRNAPVNEARLLLTLVTGDFRKRTEVMKLPSVGGAEKRGRPRKRAAVERVNGQAGEPVAVDAILG